VQDNKTLNKNQIDLGSVWPWYLKFLFFYSFTVSFISSFPITISLRMILLVDNPIKCAPPKNGSANCNRLLSFRVSVFFKSQRELHDSYKQLCPIFYHPQEKEKDSMGWERVWILFRENFTRERSRAISSIQLLF